MDSGAAADGTNVATLWRATAARELTETRARCHAAIAAAQASVQRAHLALAAAEERLRRAQDVQERAWQRWWQFHQEHALTDSRSPAQHRAAG
jgi:hypothetical protein